MAESHDSPQMQHTVEPVAGHEVQAETVHGPEASATHAAQHKLVITESHGEGHESHGDVSAQYLGPHEIPNIATLIEVWTLQPELHHGQRPHPAEYIKINGYDVIPINPLFSIFYAVVIVVCVRKAFRNASVRKPGKLQNFFEMLLGGLWNFFKSVLGEGNEKYIPYVGSLWLFIFANNIAGLIPGLKSTSTSLKTTFALGILTFLWVQFNAIRDGGFGKWIFHLMGEPQDFVTWLLMPLFFALHVMGELIKPVSLSLRLFGNIFGEDKLLAAFLGMGMAIAAAISHNPDPMIGVPLHLPFFFLALMGSTIQATVFSLLAAVYITLLLPHEHDEEEHAPEAHEGAAEAAAH